MSKLPLRAIKAEKAYSAMGTLKTLAGTISVLFSGYCVYVIASDNVTQVLGEGFMSFALSAIFAFGFCWTLDFLGIIRIHGFSISEISRWWIAPSTVSMGQRIVAVLAFAVGLAFILASGFTSYYGSKMAAGLLATKSETPKEAANVKTANKDYEAALAPFRTRLDSLEKAKAAAIVEGNKPYNCNKSWCAYKRDSVATAKDKAFAAAISGAAKSLADAEKTHGSILTQTANNTATMVSSKIGAMEAKNSAVWAVLLMFGLGAIGILVALTSVMAFMEVNATCKPEPRSWKLGFSNKVGSIFNVGGNYSEAQGGGENPKPKPNGGNGGNPNPSPNPSQRGLRPNNHSLVVDNDPTDGTMWP